MKKRPPDKAAFSIGPILATKGKTEMVEDQILVNRAMFLRLVDQYLLNRIRWLHTSASMPNVSIDAGLQANEKMLYLENLRNEFKNCDSGTEYTVSFAKLQTTFDPPDSK